MSLDAADEARKSRYQSFLLDSGAGRDEQVFQSATGVAGSEAFRHRLVRRQGRLVARRRGRAPGTLNPPAAGA